MPVVNVTAEPVTENRATDLGPFGWLMVVPRLIMLAIRLLMDSRVPGATKAALAGGMLYIVSPIDLVPDFIPVVGQLEDAVLAMLLVDMMVNSVDPRVVAEHWRGNSATLQRVGRVTGRLTKMVPQALRRRALRKTFSRQA